ncbi:MAG: T9SS type A sorting domain-containing protein [bacterium]|nr:T9SS type A sorting domain-containing protein [bacterium]
MPTVLIICLWCVFANLATAQPLEFETSTTTAFGDTALFHVQIPSHYDPNHPPAIIVGWHALGGSLVEIFAHQYDEMCEQRGWIIASHQGPNDRHWNTRLPQLHCRAMLEWLDEHYPFSHDSIYMCGASMGAAAGQVWHNNNCAYDDDYFIAATAGGSQILDCQLRQEEYLAMGDTNRSMRVAFGGLPSESDSIAYEYHRYSAVHFADTTESMHFNSLTVPIWSNWGAEQFEWDAYGYNAQRYAILRQNGAQSRFAAQGWEGHGFNIMIPEEVIPWLSQFSADRFPDTLSLTADEDGRYYYCDVTLRDSAYTFARWDIRKEQETKRLDLVFLQNVAGLTVNFVFPWVQIDTLYCDWRSMDPVNQNTQVTLTNMPRNRIALLDGFALYRVSNEGNLTIDLNGQNEFVLTFDSTHVVPSQTEIVRAYPNPFNSDLTLSINPNRAGLTTINVYDVLGRLAQSTTVQLYLQVNTVHLSVPDLPSGAYWIRSGDSTPIKVILIR